MEDDFTLIFFRWITISQKQYLKSACNCIKVVILTYTPNSIFVFDLVYVQRIMTFYCHNYRLLNEIWPWYTQGDIHLSSAGKVECVEGHLCGRLANALSCQQTHGLPGVTQRALPLQLQEMLQSVSTQTEQNTSLQQCFSMPTGTRDQFKWFKTSQNEHSNKIKQIKC